ncbi:MAG TPA: hypothetical protein VGG13_03630 [Candidatus Saccharimonadales bacterium]|jgi:hypothetical protein
MTMLTRTTLRIDTNLKRAAEKQAAENDTTLQAVFNSALEQYLRSQANAKARKIVFYTHDLGKPLDNLRRTDYYPKV